MSPARTGLILVDSSVWIECYHPKGQESLKRRLQEELVQGTVATIGLIAVEVLQGAPSNDALVALQEDFLGLHWLEVTRDLWLKAAHLGATLRQRGTSIPATDIVIAATALHYHAQLWHRDKDFTRFSRHVPAFHATFCS